MASASSSPNSPNPNPNTTFVQADPSTFRAVVQRLTGAAPPSADVRLHERRRSGTPTKLEINLNTIHNANAGAVPFVRSPSARNDHRRSLLGEINYNKVVASPVSQLEYAAAARGSPRSPVLEEEEEKAIADKGFYLHPNPGGSDPPELLPLFPLH